MTKPISNAYAHMNKSRHPCLKDVLLFLGGALFALVIVCAVSPIRLNSLRAGIGGVSQSSSPPGCATQGVNFLYDPPDETFYDDRNLSYSIEQKIEGWDDKRKEWLKHHPSFDVPGARDRVLLVTGSQPGPCKNPIGDHLLLRFYKNKADYCRIHGYDIFYNNALLHPKMKSYWGKLPVVKAAMLAHPEAEWIWWVDSDAAFTDMEFKLPLDRYKNHNMVVHGWSNMIYEAKEKSWTSLNAGVFLIRNCQWSMDLMDTWANMGPISADYKKWGRIQRSIFKDKLYPESDDQTALIYLLYAEKEKYYDHIYLESEYFFEGYWIGMVPSYDNVTKRYTEMERSVRTLRRRHAEKVSESYGARREQHLRAADGSKVNGGRRPFITHFTGCQPCNGEHNPMYTADACWGGMEKAFNFADNQVLRKYGYVHLDLRDSGKVSLVPFDYPEEEDEPWG